jgi:stage II sporulation protein D
MMAALIAVILCAASLPQHEEPPVRISVLGLLEPRVVEIGCSQPLQLEFGEVSLIPTMVAPGERLIAEARGTSLRLSIRGLDGAEEELTASERLVVSGADSGHPLVIDATAPNRLKRTVAGRLALSVVNDRLLLVLEAPLEQVVAEVVAAESGGGAPEQAAAAMAVAVRSYILAMKENSAGRAYDLLDSTQSLLYRGRDGAFGPGDAPGLALGQAAAEETRGIVLTDGEAVVPGYFHACCGGSTATPEMVWQSTTYSSSFSPCRCDLCVDSPDRHWVRRALSADVLSALGLAGAQGPVAFETVLYPGSNYVASVVVRTSSDEVVFTGERFRLLIGRSLGWDVLRSNAFLIRAEQEELVFEGYGYGHGVGLCQAGALEAARRGWDWRRILAYYYPRCAVLSYGSLAGYK